MAPVRRATHFRVGLVVLVSGGILVVTLGLLGLFGTGPKPKRYYIKFDGSVVGLRERASEVFYRGVRVGTIPEITVDSNDPHWITVAIDVRPDFRIKQRMEANIIITDLTGIREIELSGGAREDPDLAPGGSITGNRTIFEEIGGVTQNLITRSSEMIEKISAVLSPETRAHLASTIANVDQLTTEALSIPDRTRESLDALNAVVGNVDGLLSRSGDDITESVAAARRLLDDPHLSETLKSASDLVDSLNRLVDQVSSAIGQDKLRETVGEANTLVRELSALTRNVNSLLNENRAEIRRIIANLRLSSDNLKEATLALRNNPSALLRSAPAEERRAR